MYSPVNLSIRPSLLLKQGHWALHGALCLAYLSVGLSNIPYVLPLLLLQAVYIRRFQRFAYNQSRHWRFFQGQAQRMNGEQWQTVEIMPQQIWPSLLLFKYRLAGAATSWQWECIVKDGCDTEAFRQTIAVMKTEF